MSTFAASPASRVRLVGDADVQRALQRALPDRSAAFYAGVLHGFRREGRLRIADTLYQRLDEPQLRVARAEMAAAEDELERLDAEPSSRIGRSLRRLFEHRVAYWETIIATGAPPRVARRALCPKRTCDHTAIVHLDVAASGTVTWPDEQCPQHGRRLQYASLA